MKRWANDEDKNEPRCMQIPTGRVECAAIFLSIDSSRCLRLWMAHGARAPAADLHSLENVERQATKRQ